MRCKLLGIEYLVTHPGAHLGTGSAADSLNVATKIDLPGNIFPDEIPISAATGENLDQLRERLDSLAFGETAGGESLALNARHLHAIEQARAALSRADNQTAAPEIIAMELREALDALGQILCNVAPDDVLGRIFATFCVGK
jgi:tRNA modification GTPase